MYKSIEKIFRQFIPKHLKNKNKYIDLVKNSSGIEIGGPSPTFTKKGLLPIYDSISNLDGCNFSNNTVWEGELVAENGYLFSNKKTKGVQFISEGDDLKNIPNAKYDFVLSCHNLEHFANPLKAIYEWKRILKPNCYLILVLPNKEKTFDNKRPITSLEHLQNDFKKEVNEKDETHFEEVIKLHDISMDFGIENLEELKERVYKNFENRCLHHHVFNQKLVEEILTATNFELISIDLSQINIFAIAKSI